MRSNEELQALDSVDWEIIRQLAESPRQPYSDIANGLNERGYEMSSEGVRYRVEKILEVMNVFFMIESGAQYWEVILLFLTVVDEPGAKETLNDDLFGSRYWLVGNGFGTVDMYACATAQSTKKIEEILSDIGGHELVEDFEYIVETDRNIEVSNYFI